MRLSFLVLLVACGGGPRQAVIGPPPPKLTQGVLSGPLCTGETCKCRDVGTVEDGGVGYPDDDKHKRFEVRLGPSPHELWLKIGSTELYKSAEQPEQCFYVDLTTGETPVELRASQPSGVSAAWTIRELGTHTKSWYDTFHFACGSPGVCSFEELDEARQQFATYKHGVEDLCGTVKIKGLAWDTGHAPDQLHPSELLVRLVLDVYKRIPTQVHGDPSCGKGPPPSAAPDAPATNDAPDDAP
jgi:hypothetical protein